MLSKCAASALKKASFAFLSISTSISFVGAAAIGFAAFALLFALAFAFAFVAFVAGLFSHEAAHITVKAIKAKQKTRFIFRSPFFEILIPLTDLFRRSNSSAGPALCVKLGFEELCHRSANETMPPEGNFNCR